MSFVRTKQITRELSNLEDIKIFFESLRDKKQEAFDKKSDTWQEGEKGQEAQADIDSTEELISSIEEAYSKIEDIFPEEE